MRWYFKDAICFFIEAPADRVAEQFGAGDNAFCFVIDSYMPSYGAWWRHGTATKTFVEEAIPAVGRQLCDPDGPLEARSGRLHPGSTCRHGADAWADATQLARAEAGRRLQAGDRSHRPRRRVTTEAHFLLYGQGDDDSTWARMILTDPIEPIERKLE